MVRRPKLQVDPKTVSMTVPRDTSRPVDFARLRAEARAIYVCHPEGVTVREISKDPRFGAVAASTLEQWCKDDGWVDERSKTIEQWGDALKARLKKELFQKVTQVRVRQIEDTRSAIDDLVLRSADAPVKSAEGAMKVALEYQKYELELANQIAAGLGGAAGIGGADIDPRDDLTEDQVLDAAAHVLAARRDASRGLPASPEAKEDGVAKVD